MSSFPPTPSLSLKPLPRQHTDTRSGLRHVTVKQVLKAAHVEAHFEIDGLPVGFVVLLANIYDVEIRGGRLNYGLDDGTGRIKAFTWFTDESYASREVAEHRQEQFGYARVIGKISEYRGVYSIQLEKINRVVKSYDEICHHLLSCMFETQMCEHGPPGHAVVQAAIDSAKINYPLPYPNTPKTRRNDTLNKLNTEIHAPITAPGPPPPPRTPSPVTSPMQRRMPVTEPRNQRIRAPMTPPNTGVSPPNTAPQTRTYQIGNFSSPGIPDSESPSPPPTPSRARQRRPFGPSQTPVRLRSPSGPSTTSTAEVNHYLASPEFVSPTLPHPFSSIHPYIEDHQDLEDTRMDSSPVELMSEVTPGIRVAKKGVAIRRDPYSHLSSLQRDIILTIQNAMPTSREAEGIALKVIVETIAVRRPDTSELEYLQALDDLLRREYVHETIDECHFRCTM